MPSYSLPQLTDRTEEEERSWTVDTDFPGRRTDAAVGAPTPKSFDLCTGYMMPNSLAHLYTRVHSLFI